MTNEYEKYQNLKKVTLLTAWSQIELSRDAKTNQSALIRGLNQLFKVFKFSHTKIHKLLEEIVEIDKWLRYDRDFQGKINRAQFSMTPTGRIEIDELMKTNADKLMEWLKEIAPKVAKYIDETIIKPMVKVNLGRLIM